MSSTFVSASAWSRVDDRSVSAKKRTARATPNTTVDPESAPYQTR